MTFNKKHYEYSDYLRNHTNKNQVSLKLANPILLQKRNNVNSVFSPMSIHVVLGMLAATTSDGSTRDAILSFLKSESIDDMNHLCSLFVNFILLDGSLTGGPILSTANGMWKATPPQPNHKNILNSIYKAEFRQADFINKSEEVGREVNEWVEKETKGLVSDILPPGAVNEYTSLILANAMYFNGEWEDEFEASWTRPRKFYLSSGGTVRAEFMTNCVDQFISVYDGFKVLRLPYRQGKDFSRSFSMYIYLPDAIDGLPGLVNRINSEPGFLEQYGAGTQVEVGDFLIPKFKISLGLEVSKILEDLDIVFPLDKKAKIFHKSFIEVDEQGTEAAGATVYEEDYDDLGSPTEPKERLDFVADHPFIFLIKENMSEVILFMGSLFNPLASNQDY